MRERQELPTQITQTLWVGMWGSGGPQLMSSDMTKYGAAMLGQVEVTVDVPQVDPIAKRVEALEHQRDQLRGEYSQKLQRIDDQIASLQALEHQTEEA